MDGERRRFDPLALAFVVLALVTALAISAYVVYRMRADVAAPAPVADDSKVEKAADEVRKWLEEQKKNLPPPPPPPVAKAPVAKAPPPPPKPASVASLPPPPAGAATMRFDLSDSRSMRDKREYDAGEGQGYQVLGDERFVPDRLSLLREQLAAKAADRVAGKYIAVTRLMSWHVRTPKAALVEVGPGQSMPPEQVWRIPEMRKAPYWVICDVTLVVDGQSVAGRGTQGFDRPADLMNRHARALASAIDQAISALPPGAAVASERLFFPAPDAGRTWRYNVAVAPPLWRDATLTYHTQRRGQELVVKTEFRYAGGEMNFDLGVFAAAHPSHANVRFPGFFFHPAYFIGVEPRLPIVWEWPWQAPGGTVRPGRIKRYVGQAKEWTELRLQGTSYPALRIEATLEYIDNGRVEASAKETIWYMPAVRQVAKVVREGATPDEGAAHIVAELVEFK